MSGLIQAIPQIIAAVPKLIGAIVDGFSNFDWWSIGKNIVKGIAEGLKNAAGMIADAAKEAAKKAFNAAKDFLGIDSPAKKGIYIGTHVKKCASVSDREFCDLLSDIKILNKKTFAVLDDEEHEFIQNQRFDKYLSWKAINLKYALEKE